MTLNPVTPSPTTVFTTGGVVARHGWGRLLSPMHVGGTLRHIGLDLQGDRAYAVVLEPGERPALCAFASVPLTQGPEESPSLKPLARSLSTLGAGHSLVTCGLGLPHGQTAVLPAMHGTRPDPEVIRKTVEALGLDPSPGATVGVGWRTENPSGKAHTLFVAADTREADRFAHRLRRIGAGHARIATTALALETLVRNDPAAREAERCLVLHIGAQETLLGLLDEAGPVSLRQLPFASNDLSTALTRPFSTPDGRVELSPREVKILRQRLDLSQSGETLLPSGQQVDTAQVLALMRPVLERLAVEVAKFARMTTSTSTRRQSATPVFVTGEGAELQGLTKYLEHELHMDVHLLNPLAGLTVAPAGREAVRIGLRRHRLALAIGYALDPRVTVDLTPRGLRLRRAVRLGRWGLRLAVVAALITMGLQILEANNEASRIRSDIRNLQSIADSLRPLAAQVAERNAWRARLAEADARERQRDATRHEPVRHLHRLLEQLPPEFHADSIHLTQVDTATLIIEGHLVAAAERDLRSTRSTLLDRLDALFGPEARITARFQDAEINGDQQTIGLVLECRQITTGGQS